MTVQSLAHAATTDCTCSEHTGRRRPAGVRRMPTPALAPPYDDERWEERWESGMAPDDRSFDRAARLSGQLLAVHGGALALPLPLAAPSAAVPRLRLAPSPEPPAPPPPAAWSARFVRVLLEAFAGLRPISQLGAWANPDVCRLLARRAGAADRCRDLPRSTGSLRSIHVSTPAAGVAEVCAVVQFGGRVRAMALRVEAADSRWRCTELKVG
jgi:Family of unknown function (DUF6459)